MENGSINIKEMFDSHAHYNDEKFDNNRAKIIDFVKNNGTDYVCNVGTNIKESEENR